MIRILAAALAVLFLAGAAGCPERETELQVPKEVKVATPVPCIDPEDVPARPSTRSEAELFSLANGIRTDAIYADWLRLNGYADKAAGVIDKCSRIPQPARLKPIP
jgi:hypothetical protein